MSDCTVFVGTDSVRGSRGIYTLRLRDGTLDSLCSYEAYNSGFLALSPDESVLCAVSEGMTYRGLASGGVEAYTVGPRGKLWKINGLPTGGQRPCCVSFGGEDALFLCNFYGGSWREYLVDAGGLRENGPAFFESSPTDAFNGLHYIARLGSSENLGVVSLGRMSLTVRNIRTRALVSEYIAENAHPRQFAQRDGYVYLLMQTPGEVHLLENDGGRLRFIKKAPLAPEGTEELFGGSAIKLSPDGRFLAAASRDAATIRVYRADTLEIVSDIRLRGRVPRDFCFSPDGKYILAAMQFSDNICLCSFSEGFGKAVGLYPIPCPSAIICGRYSDE